MSENPIFSYTRRDYEGSRREGLAKIPIISKGHWTDLNATDPGIIILDYVHALVDMMNYYQDHQALEAFITTAKERENIFRLAKQLSYKILSAKGATCDVVFTSSMIYNHTIRIPKYTKISTMSGITYLTMQDAYLSAGETRVTVPCIQGKLMTVTYTGTGISRLSPVAGAANQSIRLVDYNIDLDSIQITDNLNRLWSPVEYITFSTELDRVYQVELNPDDTVSIKFGDGERGIIPQISDILTIQYMTSSAESGRVSENSLVILDDMILDNGQIINFSVNNPTASVGGSSVQSSQEIRELAPGVIKSQDRAVTLSDFEYLAKTVDGVADARAYDINTKPELCDYHEVKVLVTPEDPDGSVELLKKRVYDYLYRRMIPPTNLQVLTPSYIYVDIEIVARKHDRTTEGRLSYTIQQVVNDYFKEREGLIGEDFYPADLVSRLSRVEDIRTILSVTPNDVVDVQDLSVIRLGNLTIRVQ